MDKVLVGMSGGVDSSVAAHLLKKQGFEVEGVSLILWEARARRDFSSCCSLEAFDSAAQTARKLGISHSCLDARDMFIEHVIEPFVSAYGRGMTPNPCILCNRHVKFPLLLAEAKRRGAKYIATGHYAKVSRTKETDRHASGDNVTHARLMKGSDEKKDQSYVLYVLRPHELESLLLPLGELIKKEVRNIARSLDLPAAERPESQEICFIEDKNYSRFIEQYEDPASNPGPIIDTGGKVLGSHKGIFHYTIGQRKGLGALSLDPFYVKSIDVDRNTIVVGRMEEVKASEVLVSEINWLMRPQINSFRADVKIRSMMKAVSATLEVSGDKARINFDATQWAPAPGQSAVFYDGDTVLGGGIITPS